MITWLQLNPIEWLLVAAAEELCHSESELWFTVPKSLREACRAVSVVGYSAVRNDNLKGLLDLIIALELNRS
jgi:hypothetical protein